jgi:hypothetical protein
MKPMVAQINDSNKGITSVVFVMFPVVFVALNNAALIFPVGDDFISSYNVICIKEF